MTKKNETIDSSRRTFFTATAAIGAGAALAACGGTGSGGSGGGAGGGSATNEDIASLNALLAAEYKAIDAYTQGAGVLQSMSDDLSKLVLAVAVEFQKDHQEHAGLLAKTVKDLGGTATTAAANKFTLPTGFKPSTANVLKLACNEERRAAVAYNQVIKALKNSTNRFIAAAIQGDETQHYVVLAALIEGLVEPTAKLTPTSGADKVVPQAFVSATTAQGGGTGLQSEADLATNDTM